MVTAKHWLERFLRYIRSKNEWAPNCVCGAGAVMMLDCMTCKWISWCLSIPLILLLGACGNGFTRGLHMRFGHVENLPGEGGTRGAAEDFVDFWDDSMTDTA